MFSTDGDYQSALDFIEARSGYARGFISVPVTDTANLSLGLKRMRALLDALGSPDRAFPVVHIAGSKGKGSTAAFTAAIGKAAGYRTGLSTSPHLHSFRERIDIDGAPISQQEFARIGGLVRVAAETLERAHPELGSVTAFEVLTAMALLSFADAGCDLAVIEVGMGGTYDATNVIEPDVTVISRLDLEHTQVLGETIAEIAANKAGIIKPGVPVVTAQQDSSALEVIVRAAQQRDAPLWVAGRDFRWFGGWSRFEWHSATRSIDELRTSMPGDHQMENASLAIASWQMLQSRGFTVSDEAIRQGLQNASLPGRFERTLVDGREWIFDGAHTPVAASALSDTLLHEFGRPVGVIVGMLRDKHPAQFFASIAPAAEILLVTTPHSPRAIPASELIASAKRVNAHVIASENFESALDIARVTVPLELPIVVTGSFTLVAEARERFGLAANNR